MLDLLLGPLLGTGALITGSDISLAPVVRGLTVYTAGAAFLCEHAGSGGGSYGGLCPVADTDSGGPGHTPGNLCTAGLSPLPGAICSRPGFST